MAFVPKGLRLRRRSVARLERRADVRGLIEALGRRDVTLDRYGQRIDLALWDRLGAAEALGRIAPPEAVPALSRAVEDPLAQVRLAALEALMRIEGPDAVKALADAALRLVAPEDGAVRERALGLLEARIEGASPQTVHHLAERTLQGSDDSQAFTHVVSLVAAKVGTGETGEHCRRCVERLRSADPGERERAARLLVALGPPVLDHLEPCFADPELAPAVARVFGELRDARGIPALLELLTSPDPATRSVAADALGHIQDPRATYALLASTVDSEHAVRAAAIRALDALGPMPAAMVVGQLLQGAFTPGADQLSDRAADLVKRLTGGSESEVNDLTPEAGPPRR